MTERKCTVPKVSLTPTFITATPLKPTAPRATIMPSRKQVQRKVGRSRSMKRNGITASRKRWRTLWIACRTTRSLWLAGKMAAPCWKPSSRHTNPRAPVEKWGCPSRRMRKSHTICGSQLRLDRLVGSDKLRDVMTFVICRFRLAFVAAGIGAFLSGASAAEWSLVWSDEFAQPDGSAPDSTKWVYDLGAKK